MPVSIIFTLELVRRPMLSYVLLAVSEVTIVRPPSIIVSVTRRGLSLLVTAVDVELAVFADGRTGPVTQEIPEPAGGFALTSF